MTEGVHTMVIDTLGYEIPIRKSRMIPRQERLVLELIKSRKPQEFSFNAKSQDKQYHILSFATTIHARFDKERKAIETFTYVDARSAESK